MEFMRKLLYWLMPAEGPEYTVPHDERYARLHAISNARWELIKENGGKEPSVTEVMNRYYDNGGLY